MDVYDISDDLVKKLNDWKLIGIISGKFNELKENCSKVNFVEHALIDFKYMEKIFLNVTLRENKCNKRSVEFRMLGNEQFSLKNRKYFQVSTPKILLHSENVFNLIQKNNCKKYGSTDCKNSENYMISILTKCSSPNAMRELPY